MNGNGDTWGKDLNLKESIMTYLKNYSLLLILCAGALSFSLHLSFSFYIVYSIFMHPRASRGRTLKAGGPFNRRVRDRILQVYEDIFVIYKYTGCDRRSDPVARSILLSIVSNNCKWLIRGLSQPLISTEISFS